MREGRLLMLPVIDVGAHQFFFISLFVQYNTMKTITRQCNFRVEQQE